MEAVGAVSYLMSGSNILIMRHPEAIRMVKAYIDLAADGGSAADVAGIAKGLDDVNIDYAAIAPEPDLTIEEEKKAAPAKKAAAPKAAEPPKEAAPTAPAAPAEPAPTSVSEVDSVAKSLGIDLEKLLQEKGCTREDIEHTAEKYNLTVEQTLKKLGGIS
jgi:acetyl-CoA decarbonylase/synthase complex subunit delta